MIPTQTLSKFLEERGFKGQIQEALSDYLDSLGFPGQLNEAIFNWLRSLGYEGSLAEMIQQWISQFIPEPANQWIVTPTSDGFTIEKMPEVSMLIGTGGPSQIIIG